MVSCYYFDGKDIHKILILLLLLPLRTLSNVRLQATTAVLIFENVDD